MIELEIQNNNQVLELEQVEVVATRTSQLINDGEDGTHPFIDATDISGKADTTYVDAQDLATLNSAKGYTDTRETSIKNWADGKFLTEHQDISHLASKTYVDNGLALKQDKINDLASIRAGAVLGTTSIQPNDNVSELVNDAGYLTQHQSLSAYRTSAQQDVIDNTKVDKVQGKGLSENDYTTAEKNKLSGIQNGAEVNVQSDWNQTNQSADDYIKNKPTIPSLDNYYTKSETDNAISGHHDPSKQDTLVSGTNIKTINNQSLLGSGNIQIDGGVQSVNGQTGVVVLDAEDVGALPSSTSIPTKTSDLTNDSGFITNSYHDSTKQDVISDLSTIRSGASLGTTSIQPNDNVSELTNDAGYLTSHQSLSNYYNKTETDTLLNAKQDNLPSVVNDRYLHTNSSTGALEWSVVQGSVVALTTQEVDTIWENN